MRAAFDTWERIAAIDFVEVSSASADIQLGYDTFDGRGGRLGEARWSYQGNLNTHAEIAIDSADYPSPFLYGADTFYALVVHEIGHAIGLGHTSDPSSIMYPYLGAQQQPSAADIAAIQAIYGPAGAAGRLVTGTAGSEGVYGHVGNDTIDAGAGDDVVYGFAGADLIYGGTGADYVEGGEGNDTLSGNQDNDRLFGHTGVDVVYGGQGNDAVQGNQGDDSVYGDRGNDTVYGGQGNDWVYGGRDDDFVFGDRGNDTVHGGFGNDTLAGGQGADLFLFEPGHGNDVITDFRSAEGDRLSLGGQSYNVSESGGSAVLSLSGGGTITLLGVTAASLDLAAVA